MTIAIWDLDWFEKTTIMPNVGCMKLSSYHQQKGNTTFLVRNLTDLNIAYDRLCIFKERKDTPINHKAYLTMPTSVLFGKGFSYYKVSTLGKIVWACRPDYLLYPKEMETPYTNANLLTFFCGTERLNKFQDYHNTNLHHKKNLIVDKEFWNAADEDIIWCLNYLKDEKNIAFAEPISLRKLMNNTVLQEKFLALNFSLGTEFRWRNNLGDGAEEAKTIIAFLEKMRLHTKSRLGIVPFRATTSYCANNDEVAAQLVRCLQIATLFKQAKHECLFVAPPKTHLNARPEFDLLQSWSQQLFKLSLVEYILHYKCLTTGMTWHTILNNPTYWDSNNILLLVSMLVNPQYEMCRRDLFAQWGYSELNSNLIDVATLSKNLSLLYREGMMTNTNE